MTKLENMSFSELKGVLKNKVNEGKKRLAREKVVLVLRKQSAKALFKKYKKGKVNDTEKAMLFELLRRTDW
jgi:septum formation inhibitor MinC